jgi:hypothetical protein
MDGRVEPGHDDGTAWPGAGFFSPGAPCLARHPRLELRPTEGGKPPVMAPGEVAEWSIAPHSKCGIGASLSGVRIPPSPPPAFASAQKFKLSIPWLQNKQNMKETFEGDVTAPAVTIPIPPAAELKDPIWAALANAPGK